MSLINTSRTISARSKGRPRKSIGVVVGLIGATIVAVLMYQLVLDGPRPAPAETVTHEATWFAGFVEANTSGMPNLAESTATQTQNAIWMEHFLAVNISEMPAAPAVDTKTENQMWLDQFIAVNTSGFPESHGADLVTTAPYQGGPR